MRGLDDKGNPYAGQYSEFDRWARGHAVDPDRQTEAEDEFLIGVDSEGFVVPMAQQLEWQLNPPEDYTENECEFKFWAGATLDPKLKSWVVDVAVKNRAAAIALLPEWLAKDPPRWACPLSSGEFLTIGALNSGIALEPDVNMGVQLNVPRVEMISREQPWCCYSKDGELLGEVLSDGEYWRLFFEDFDATCQEIAGDLDYVYREYDGTIVIYEKTSWQELAIFDFQGNPMPLNDGLHGAKQLFTWLFGGNIPLIHQAQQACAGQNT